MGRELDPSGSARQLAWYRSKRRSGFAESGRTAGKRGKPPYQRVGLGGVEVTVPVRVGEARGGIRVLNASPDLPVLDVYVDGSRAFSAVGYGQLTDYVRLAKGLHTVTVYEAGGVGGKPLAEISVNLRRDQEYTIAVLGRAEHTETLTIKDSTPPALPGRVRIRMLNLVPGPPMDVSIRGVWDLFRNVSYKEVTGYAETATGTVDLQFAAAGGKAPVMTIDDYRLAPGGRYTLIVLGKNRHAAASRVLPVEDRA